MTGQWDTRESVRRYIATVFDTDREFAIYEATHGWVCQQVLTEEEQAAGLGMGLGNYVVDRRSGVITAHPSLHPLTIGERYDAAVAAGDPAPGHQIYPPTWEIRVERGRENDTEIEYRVHARSLVEPAVEPPSDHRVIIEKNANLYRTEPEGGHIACSHAVAWAERIGRPSGKWPDGAAFRV